MAADHEGFKLDRQGKVAILTLNRPEVLNALTARTLLMEIPRTLQEVADDEGIRVLVITGAGRAFCSGLDVSDLTPQKAVKVTPDPWAPRYSVTQRLRNIPKPSIAAVNGVAAGAGLALALACDIRIASENARFGSVFVRRGLVPDCGVTFFLPDMVGTGRALELMWTGDIIDAREADRIGMVNRVVPADVLLSNALELANRLASAPPITVALTKRVVYQFREKDLLSQLEYEAYSQRLCRDTDDFTEGVQAFKEKRPPVFKGS